MCALLSAFINTRSNKREYKPNLQSGEDDEQGCAQLCIGGLSDTLEEGMCVAMYVICLFVLHI
jgi:hypothetical protein